MLSKRNRRILLVVAVVLAYAGLRTTLQHMARMEHASGEPATVEELKAWYPPVPDAENAALVYEKAYSAAVDRQDLTEMLPFFGLAVLPEPGTAMPEGMRAALAGYVGANGACLRLLHEAAALPRSHYPVDFGNMAVLRHYGDARKATRLLAMEAVLEAEQGRGEKAAASLLAGFAVMKSLEGLPCFSAFLNCCSGYIMLRAACERVVSTTVLTEAELSGLAVAVMAADPSYAAGRGLVGARCGAVAYFANPKAYLDQVALVLGTPPLSFFGAATWRAYRWSGLASMDQRHFNKVFLRWKEVREKPLEARISAANALDAEVDALPEWESLITRDLFGEQAVFRLTVTELDALANVRVIGAALAIERFRLAKGSVPDHVEQLVPDFCPRVLADPYTGKPLCCERRESGYCVYSIGKDMRGDGGEKGGIAFTVTR